MEIFLDKLSEKIIQEFQIENLDKLCIIFPNTRASIFFRHALSKRIENPIWAPEILGIDDFIKSHSPLQVPHKLKLIFELYKVYNKISSKKEAFNQFYFWAEVMLKDFEDIDKYQVEANRIFDNIKDLKQIDDRFDFFSEEDKKLVSSYWESLQGANVKHQENFASTWEILPKVYDEYKAKLKSEGIAYTAMVHQDVLERLADGSALKVYDKVIFAGFNALTFTEENIIKWYVENRNAEIFWDADQYYFQDKSQEAGNFLREYARDEVLKHTFPNQFPNLYSQKKEVKVTGVALEIGQAKLLGEELLDLKRSYEERGEELEEEQVAIVIPNEALLFPVLHSIPEEFKNLNITMGYPLQNTNLYSFVEGLFELQLKKGKDFASFGSRQVIQLLKHSYLNKYDALACKDCIDEIQNNNMILIPQSFLLSKDYPLFNLIFKKVENPENLFEYLMDILIFVHQVNFKVEEIESEEELENQSLESSNHSDREFIHCLYLEIAKFSELMKELASQMTFDLKISIQLLRQMIRTIKVPFEGNLLNGIQIMGVLETRNLDFKHVFLLSMNEATFPAAPNNQSFIPYSLRKAFRLPTFEQHDAMYSYLFYRFLQNPKSINFYYNTESGGKSTGEKSRFLLQFLREYPKYSGFGIEENTLSNPTKLNSDKGIHVRKDSAIDKKLERFFMNNDDQKYLTATALSTYMSCSLRFFFKYLMEMREEDELEDTMNAGIFGSIFHYAMEQIYVKLVKRKESRSIEKQDFEFLRSVCLECVEEGFKVEFNKSSQEQFKFQGRNIIARDVIEKMCQKVLDKDAVLAPFELLGTELGVEDGVLKYYNIKVKDEIKKVGIKGRIDRVDQKDELIRILDYKTGSDDKDIGSKGIEALFTNKNKKAAFQLFLYSDIYNTQISKEKNQLYPVIYRKNDLFDPEAQDELSFSKNIIKDIRTFLPEFNEHLQTLLEDIFDPLTDFQQTEDVSTCQYCEFSGICHRD